MIVLLILSIAAAVDMPERLPPHEPLAGECSENYPISKGQPLPVSIVESPSDLSKCSGVAVPLSQYADLLATESWGKAVSERYTIDTTALEADRDWYKAKLEAANQPLPFLERPGTQRWLGRIETLVTVGVVTVGLGTAYHYSSGGFQ